MQFARSKAQHLVELVLFFPFLIGIIGLLTEIAYGLNTGIELNSALNRAVGIVSSVQRTASNASEDDIRNEIYTNARSIMIARNVPYVDTLAVETLDTDGFLVTIGTYNYTYAFVLVNMFFSAIPEKFYFKSVVISNKALFAPNSYTIDDASLTKTLNNYAVQGGGDLQEFFNQLLGKYEEIWGNDHKKIWEDYVEKIKEEQKKKAEEEAKKEEEANKENKEEGGENGEKP